MVALASAVAAFSLLAAGPVVTSSEPVLTLSVTGRGWGHGVGMSQWGAYGYAQHGSTYGEILAHYYSGTELARAPAARIRVLLLEGAKSALIGSFSPFVVETADGQLLELTAASYRLGPTLELDGQALAPPLTLRPRGSPLLINGAPYRGTVELTVSKGKIRAINTLPLESYVLGVVPREVPATWPAEALKAQAVAARSYALATRKTGGDFDVYPDTRSQVYGGVDAETDATNAAVEATAREVVSYAGKVATTYFFSTSGGRTVDVTEAWPGSNPVPYLVSVPDPYDSASPVHRWGPIAVPAAKLQRALKLPANPVGIRVQRGGSGRATQVVVSFSDGTESSVPAGTVRTALGLRSTWFGVGVLSLAPPAQSPVVFGSKVSLGVETRGVSGAVLQRRALGGAWEQPAPRSFRAEQTADYRLATPKLKGAVLRVPVAPRVKLSAAEGALHGSVRPVMPGAVVLVQRLEGLRWTTIAKPLVDDEGAYTTEQLELSPGAYRARVAPRLGYAAGVSRSLSVGS